MAEMPSAVVFDDQRWLKNPCVHVLDTLAAKSMHGIDVQIKT
jgi:hypothetical protein